VIAKRCASLRTFINTSFETFRYKSKLSLRSRLGPFAMPRIGISLRLQLNPASRCSLREPPSVKTRSGMGQRSLSIFSDMSVQSALEVPPSTIPHRSAGNTFYLNLRLFIFIRSPSSTHHHRSTADVPKYSICHSLHAVSLLKNAWAAISISVRRSVPYPDML